MPALRKTWSTNRERGDLRASSGLVSAIRVALASIEGVQDVRLLHRADKDQVSKFFVVMHEPSLEVVERVVTAMVQIEEAFAGAGRFDYDTVPRTRDALIPDGARSILHAGAS
jgi:hypothetical protein